MAKSNKANSKGKFVVTVTDFGTVATEVRGVLAVSDLAKHIFRSPNKHAYALVLAKCESKHWLFPGTRAIHPMFYKDLGKWLRRFS